MLDKLKEKMTNKMLDKLMSSIGVNEMVEHPDHFKIEITFHPQGGMNVDISRKEES